MKQDWATINSETTQMYTIVYLNDATGVGVFPDGLGTVAEKVLALPLTSLQALSFIPFAESGIISSASFEILDDILFGDMLKYFEYFFFSPAVCGQFT